MKKLFKILGYILLAIILLSAVLLVALRFLAPVIVEKELMKDLSRHGYEARVDIEIDKLSPFGVEIPLARLDMGSGELELRNLELDVESLLSSRHELRLELEEVKMNISDELLGYLESNGVPGDKLSRLYGRNLSLLMDSLYFLADSRDIYAELGSIVLGVLDDSGKRNVISTDGLKATASTSGTDLMVTPVDIYCNGTEILDFVEGIYSEGRDTLVLGDVVVHAFQEIPEIKLDDLKVEFIGDGIKLDSSKVVVSSFDKLEAFFDVAETGALEVLVEDDARFTVRTDVVLSGEKKLLDDLGLELELVGSGNRIEIDDGAIFHRKLKGRIPFKLALEGNVIEVEIAGSRRFDIDRNNPDESVISEMISFALLKLASSIFGL